jgi:hypothetical protein
MLFDEKIKFLNQFRSSFNKEIFKKNLECNYHGIGLSIYTKDEKFTRSLTHFIPESWLKSQSSNYEIYLLSPEYFNYGPENWANETLQDCISLEHNTIAVQRDFAAWFIGPNQVFLICEDAVSDGFHNFLRWFISERLIAMNKYVIHASCILDKAKRAHVFLGHSGAGKTTITQLSSPRLTLGDDMNIISFDRDNLTVEAGAIGGLFNSMIGYDNKMPVKAIYWLKQSSENKLIKLSSTIAQQKLLASFANLNWPTLPETTSAQLIDFSFKVVAAVAFYELEFIKDAAIWKILDP